MVLKTPPGSQLTAANEFTVPFDVGEGLSRADVVDNDDTVGSPVISRRDRSKPLLTRRVPYLKLHPGKRKQSQGTLNPT